MDKREKKRKKDHSVLPNCPPLKKKEKKRRKKDHGKEYNLQDY